jgi:hypothetical protein
MEGRVVRLLGDFSWGRIDDVFGGAIRRTARQG